MSNNKLKHKQIKTILLNERRNYANDWNERDSADFEKEGYYEWMTSFVEGYTKILEIGTGSGRSTAALLNAGHKVISIEENVECIKIAQGYLKKKFKCQCIYRGNIKPNHSKGTYSVSYKTIENIDSDADVILLEGDILKDQHLYDWLKTSAKIDAIVCWLIGSHAYRIKNEILAEDHNEVVLPDDYRFLNQNFIYDLANVILKDNGILNIIDRTRILTEKSKNTLYLSHVDQAKTTTLKVSSEIATKKFIFPLNGVKMGIKDRSISNNDTRGEFASVIATK